MRIRTQLLSAVAASMLLGGAAVVAVLVAARAERDSGAALQRAQATAHEVTGLLVLTQDYARHAEATTAEQWHARHAAIGQMLAQAPSSGQPAALIELRAVSQALPDLFGRLRDLPADGSPFAARRREMLLDQMLASTQAMSDHAYQWFQDSALARQQDERRFQLLAGVVPLAMLGLLLGLAAMLRRRVLQPLRALQEAARAVGRGDLSVRINGQRDDELGELAHQFDRMTAALAQARLETLIGRPMPLPPLPPPAASSVPPASSVPAASSVPSPAAPTLLPGARAPAAPPVGTPVTTPGTRTQPPEPSP